MFNKNKIALSLVALFALVAVGCATMGLGQASTVRGKFFQARVEYSQLLILANEYKASPTADPVVVAKFQEIDLKVQDVEKEVFALLAAGDVAGADSKVALLAVFVTELRNQLVARGLVEVR